MGWNLKQQAKDRIVTGLFALIVLLLLIVWKAIPSSVWDRVSEATPKRALWALLALAGIAICLLTGALIDNWRKRKPTSPEPPKLQYFRVFGLFWDDNLNPFCPADETLLSTWSRTALKAGGFYEVLRCPKCKNQFALRDDVRGLTTLHSMKQTIRNMIDDGELSD